MGTQIFFRVKFTRRTSSHNNIVSTNIIKIINKLENLVYIMPVTSLMVIMSNVMMERIIKAKAIAVHIKEHTTWSTRTDLESPR